MTSSNLVSAITDLNVEDDDVIFFYYVGYGGTGHGERTSSKKTPWPNLTFIDGKSLDLGSIKEGLKQKKPRLVIAFAQAANRIVSPQEATPLVELKIPAINRPFKKSDSLVYDSTNAYAELFLNTSGCIIASAAVPGTYAQGSEAGGDFTRMFVAHLQNAAANKDKISWQLLFERMVRSMDDGSRWSSRPVFSVEQPKYWFIDGFF